MPRSFIAAIMTTVGAVALATVLLHPAAASEPASLSCAGRSVLDRVADNFRYTVTHVPDLAQVRIVGFDHVREDPYPAIMNSWGGSAVARQYCRATARLSNGSRRSVFYLIEAGMGFASIGDHVESCVADFDPWHVYGGNCRVLR